MRNELSASLHSCDVLYLLTVYLNSPSCPLDKSQLTTMENVSCVLLNFIAKKLIKIFVFVLIRDTGLNWPQLLGFLIPFSTYQMSFWRKYSVYSLHAVYPWVVLIPMQSPLCRNWGISPFTFMIILTNNDLGFWF